MKGRNKFRAYKIYRLKYMKIFFLFSLPSRPVTSVSYWRVSIGSAGSPFINHCKCAAGLDLPDVQLSRTISPI